MSSVVDYQVVSAPVAQAVYTPYGGVRDFFYDRSPEVVAHGPAETGKTLASCWLLHLQALKYPGAQIVMLRKTYKSLMSSAFQTLKLRVLDKTKAPVTYYGGHKPTEIIYPNGSIIWLAGLDDPAKVLSSERDVIYYNQCEEGTLGEWETLTTRATGRAGNMPYAQVIGDANPGPKNHWLVERAEQNALKFHKTRHVDNPTLYDPATGLITPQGIETMRRLDKLTGIRKKRLRDGEWVSAEGVIYEEYNEDIHVKHRDFGEFKYWLMCADDGYTNPAVVLLVGVDEDWNLHIYDEFYQSGHRHAQIAAAAVKMLGGVRPAVVACDSSAPGLIAEFINHGLFGEGATGVVTDGIDAIKELLAPTDGEKPKLTVAPNCKNVQNEFQSYVWDQTRDGTMKDTPKKINDHAMDAIRYLINWLFDEKIFIRTVQHTIQIGNW